MRTIRIPATTLQETKKINDEGWFVVEDDTESAIEGINSRLKFFGLEIAEGVDEEGGTISGDWWLKIDEGARTITRTRLDIGVSSEVGSIEEVVDLCTKLGSHLEDMGMLKESSGSGGGYRDMQFDGEEDLELALKAKKFAIDWLTEKLGDPKGGTMEDGLWYVNLSEFSYRSI